MIQVGFVWDLEDDVDGNYWHVCVEGHGVTRKEVEEVVTGDYDTAARSRSSGQPEAFGWTSTGKYITVVFEQVSDDPLPSTLSLLTKSHPPARASGGRNDERPQRREGPPHGAVDGRRPGSA